MFYVLGRKWVRSFGLILAVVAVLAVLWSATEITKDRETQEGLSFGPQYVPASATMIQAASESPQEELSPQGKPKPEASEGQTSVKVEAVAGGLYDEYRLARVKNRSRRTEFLQVMSQADGVTETQRHEFQGQLLTLMELNERESQVENLLRAKGITDAVVMVGEGGTNVVVPTLLTRDEASRVGDLVAGVAGTPLDRITIIDGATGK